MSSLIRFKSMARLCLGILLYTLAVWGLQLTACQVEFTTTPLPALPLPAVTSTSVSELTRESTATPLSTSPPIRTVGASTLDLQEAWRFHTGPANNGDSALPQLFVAGRKVIISYGAGQRYGDENFASWLTALSLESGQTVWQTRLEDLGNGTYMDSGYLDSERLYLVYSFRVNAFSLETGELLWSTPNLGGHTGYRFYPWEAGDPLLLHSSHDELIAVNPRTGEVLSRQPDSPMYLERDGIEFIPTMTGLYAVDRQKPDQPLWERLEMQPAYRQLQRWPTFIGDDMVYESGDPCHTIIRINFRTGQVIWETPERNYLSNFAVAGSLVYALREDTTLVAFDLESGAIVGTLEFDGPPADTICAKSGSHPYWVVVNGEYVLVYFGDTRELIALRP